MSDVLMHERNGVLWLQLNRPERRNAYDLEMATTLHDHLLGASAYESVVITGSGGSFCAGGALTQLDDPDPDQLLSLIHISEPTRPY